MVRLPACNERWGSLDRARHCRRQPPSTVANELNARALRRISTCLQRIGSRLRSQSIAIPYFWNEGSKFHSSIFKPPNLQAGPEPHGSEAGERSV